MHPLEVAMYRDLVEPGRALAAGHEPTRSTHSSQSPTGSGADIAAPTRRRPRCQTEKTCRSGSEVVPFARACLASRPAARSVKVLRSRSPPQICKLIGGAARREPVAPPRSPCGAPASAPRSGGAVLTAEIPRSVGEMLSATISHSRRDGRFVEFMTRSIHAQAKTSPCSARGLGAAAAAAPPPRPLKAFRGDEALQLQLQLLATTVADGRSLEAGAAADGGRRSTVCRAGVATRGAA
eukprot:165679-Chlamydomonas_euryale.AAC.1